MSPHARDMIAMRIRELHNHAERNDTQAADLRGWASKWADKASLQRAEAAALQRDLDEDAQQAADHTGFRADIDIKGF